MKKNFNYICDFGFCLWFDKFLIHFLSKMPFCSKLKQKVSNNKNKRIINYLKNKYYDIILRYKSIEKIPENKNSNIVWIFWWQGLSDAPEIVKKCIKSVKYYCKNKKIIIIDQKNINQYYDIPAYIKDKLNSKKISMTHFSDILRMNLLNSYGGFWMDATILLTDNPFKKDDNEFFTVKLKDTDLNSITQGKWCGFFIGGNNPLLYSFMTDFFNIYWKNENIIIDYFLIDYVIKIAYDEILIVKNKFDAISNNNMRIFDLQKNLNNRYDNNFYIKLLKDNCVHKLSYKNNITNDNKTFYSKIILDR